MLMIFAHPIRFLPQRRRCARDAREDRGRALVPAKRKSWSIAEAERWLAPILNYDPSRARQAAE
jgi:5-methyltetrahydrofolate--homocysteine methyltransferase